MRVTLRAEQLHVLYYIMAMTALHEVISWRLDKAMAVVRLAMHVQSVRVLQV